MSENTETKGKIAKLNLNHSAPKKDGSTFQCIALKLEGSDEAILVSLGSAAGKYAKEKLDLKVGDEIALTRGGQYNSVIKISKAGGGYTANSFKGGKKSFTKTAYDNSGQIKGMVLNNAVSLVAQGLVDVKDGTVTDSIIEAAKIVLAARAETDKLVEAVLPKSTEAKTETKKLDPFATTETTSEVTLKSASNDFASDDEIPF